MQFWLKMDAGPVEVTGDQIETLRRKGDLPAEKRLISVDGGKTWHTYAEVLELKKREPPPKITKVYSKCENCNAILENTSDMVGRTDTCGSCGRPYQIRAEDARSKIPLIVTIVVIGIGAVIAGWLMLSG